MDHPHQQQQQGIPSSAVINYGFQYYPESIRDVIEKVKGQRRCDISIAWRNLQYEVKEFGGIAGHSKPILRRLNGFFEANTLNALMGPSGAGKTTLLNFLSGTVRGGLSADSEIYLNRNQKSHTSYFIEQHVHESIVGRMTVGQILRYAFQFKNGLSEGALMRQHIEQTMHELMLPSELLTRPYSQCSGGEQKRVAIAQELMCLSAPSFLFLDEPTTGLDSAAALQVVQCLQQLTAQHRITVVASIHAPNNQTLSLFHKLYVLAKGGVCIYSGPPNQIQPYLEHEIEFKIAAEQPPIEALIRVACNGLQDPTVQCLSQKSVTSQHSQITSHLHELTFHPSGLPITRKPFTFSNFILQLSRLLRITYIADCRIFGANILLILLYYTIMATMFNPQIGRPSSCLPLDGANLNSSSLNSAACATSDIYDNSLIMENICFLSYSFMFIGYLMICSSAQFFLPIVKVFRSEHRNHWYSTGVFYWSSLLLSLIQVTILACLMSAVSYFFTRQHLADNYELNLDRFSSYTFLIWLLCFYMESIGKLIGSVLLDYVKLAIILCQLLYSFMCMLNGFYIEIDDTGSQMVIQTADLIAIRFITKNMIYTIYGIDRCSDSEYSWIMWNNNVEVDKIRYNWVRVVVNIVLVQLVTFIFMYFKFNHFHDHPAVKLVRKCNEKQQEALELNQAIEIEYDAAKAEKDDSRRNEEIVHVNKIEKETFEDPLNKKILIAWRNLTLYGSSTIYEVGSTKVIRKPILQNLNGQFQFGTLNALMGTSGAGKTSLLKVLNGRLKTRLSDTTRFYLSKFAKITTCFITQEVSGHLIPGLTAKQMLVYASRMKNANEAVDHEAIATKVLDSLDLHDTINTHVDRCSGGERKRLALALELTSLQMPNLICIDEPTSGLDSNSAEIVISCLRKLTHAHNLTIIASIHQPNAEILAMFDQLYVLARGGVCVYSGPPNQIHHHLSKMPEITSPEPRFAIEQLITHSCFNHENYLVQQLVQLTDHQFANHKNRLTEDTELVPDGVVHNRSRFTLHAVHILTLRYASFIKGYLWFPQLFYFVNFLLFSYFLNRIFDPEIAQPSGCVSLDEDLNSTCLSSGSTEKVLEMKQITNNYRYSFYMTSVCMFNLVLNSALQFSAEFEVLKNEHRNGWYSAGAFYLVKCIYEIVPTIPLMLAHIYICNIYEDIRPGIYWPLTGLFILTAIALQGMAHIFSLLSNGNLMLLTSMVVLVYVSCTMVGNFFLSLANLHYFYQFASNFSIPRHIFESFMLLQYGFGRCGPKQVQSVLYVMGLEDADFAQCVAMLLANLVLYRVVTVYLLIRKLNPVENRRTRVARILERNTQLEPARSAIAGLDASSSEFHIKITNS